VLATILVAGAITGLALPQVVLAAEPPHETPTSEPPPPGSRGELEIGLGVLLSGTAVGLVAFGAVQFVRAREHVEFCNAEPPFIDELDDPSGIDPCRFDPPALGFASAGLSWGFSAALFVGAGLLLARGVRLQKRARRHDRMQAVWRTIEPVPWWRAGGGLALRWQF
jgi:hypothetical protein